MIPDNLTLRDAELDACLFPRLSDCSCRGSRFKGAARPFDATGRGRAPTGVERKALSRRQQPLSSPPTLSWPGRWRLCRAQFVPIGVGEQAAVGVAPYHRQSLREW